MLLGFPKLVTAAAICAVALTSCGGGDDDEGSGGDRSASGAFPVTVKHEYGSTQVEGAPERVVTVGFTDQDFVLALGVKPVGVREFFGGRPQATWDWAQDELGEAEPTVLPSAELDFERIASLRPDLIIGLTSGMTEGDYSKLSQIAPTLAQPAEYPDFGIPWEEQTRLVGRALGRAGQAERIVAGVKERFARAREDNPEFEGASAVFATVEGEGQFSAYSTADPRGRFLDQLGFEIPEEIDKLAGDRFFTSISNEQFRLLDADLLVTLEFPGASQEAVEADPLYGRLRAVREGRDVYLDYEDELSGALSFSSPLSLPFALDEAVPRLAAAVDGDPATVVEKAR
jgi:iron complex transport system substrate-binding protein